MGLSRQSEAFGVEVDLQWLDVNCDDAACRRPALVKPGFIQCRARENNPAATCGRHARMFIIRNGGFTKLAGEILVAHPFKLGGYRWIVVHFSKRRA
jgi:hypothetical protein